MCCLRKICWHLKLSAIPLETIQMSNSRSLRSLEPAMIDVKIDEQPIVENVVSQTTNSAVLGSSSGGDDYFLVDPFESKKM